MKNAAKLLTGLLLLVFFFTGGRVQATPSIDQQQPVIDASEGGLSIGGASQQKLAQVVTAGVTGVLTEVRFPVACASGDLVIEIQGVAGGIPNGAVLTSQTIPGAGLPSFFPVPGVVSLRSFVFSTPVSISAGNQFAVVLSSSGECGVFQGPVGDSYPGGNAFFDARPNPAGLWVCMCDFMGARLDLPFQTIVDPPFKPALQVSIDIKPGDVQNSVNPASQGRIPVAILSNADFDATSRVDRTSLTFGRTGDEQSLAFCNSTGEDVNSDGLPDLVCHFITRMTGFTAGDQTGILKGRAVNGQPVSGRDSVRIVPPIGGAVDTTPPAVVATTPVNGAVGVAITAAVTAAFSEPIDCVTLTGATFIVRDASSAAVPGTVTCSSSTATFTPVASLAYSTTYTAVITTAAKDAAGNALVADYFWNFTTIGPPFAGGDYWVMEYNVCPNVWPVKPLSEYTEEDWALVRRETGYNLNWRSRATLSPSDANGSGLVAFTDFWTHRHKVDQSVGSDSWGITPGTGAIMATVGYTLAANNELSIALNGDAFHMAMSRDGNFFTGVHREAGSSCQNIMMAVKAATAPVTINGLYGMVDYYNFLWYVQRSGASAPDPAATQTSSYAQVAWLDQAVPAARLSITDYVQIYNPTLPEATGHATDTLLGGAQGPITTNSDGTITTAAQQGIWIAASPDGEMNIRALGTSDSYPPVTDITGNTTFNHMLGIALSLKQDPGRAFTAADVLGTYFLASRRDDVSFAVPGTIGMVPPAACASAGNDEPGSATCGTGVHPRWTMSWGRITFNADGTANIDLNEFNDQQQETPLMATGTFTVRKECYGNSGTSRLSWDDPVCTGGRILDVLVINDGLTDIAKFFIGVGGDVLAFYEPEGFSPLAGLAGQSRWIGSAVRLK